ncbi:MAG: xanthan lyase [Bacteroidales bacterium]|nr:xanthan lyase [Bacteroidales bacterium]
MKRLLSAVLFLSCVAVWAQKPLPKDFKPVTDSLQVLLQERTGVKATFSLERIMKIGKTLDFYFSRDLGDYPWRPGDEKWFKNTFKSLSGSLLKGYNTGIIMCGRLPLSDFQIPALRSDGKPLDNAFRIPARESIPLVRGRDSWPEGLTGRHIALWQSHGLYYDSETGRWTFQRSATHSTLEDVYTQGYVLPFLIPMLENAGAVTMTPRERDTQVYEVVCDNDPAFEGERTGLLRRKGSYLEKGPWTDTGEGFADAKAAYEDHDNPFTMGSTRKTAVSSGNKAQAIWTAQLPAGGDYAVYVSYKTLPESTTDARYTICHKGGETLVHVNQKMGGGTWIYLGTYTFGDTGKVILSSRSSDKGVVTADAVRFGGGMGKADRGAGISGMPAYVEGALSSMQYGGTPITLFDDWDRDYTKDFAGRGRWVKDLSGRGIPFDCSLAFHSDAGITPDSTIVGTLGIYTYKSEEGTKYADGSSRLAGRLLTDIVQSQIVGDIKSLHEPLWTRRQTWDRSYSESRTTGVPGMLLEILSHQNFADMRHGLDPQFRFDVSRAVYKGILKFLSARYGVPYTVQPLPVHAFRVDLDGTEAVLSWKDTADPLESTAAASGYRIYTRIDDGVFDEGTDCSSRSFKRSIEPGHIYSFKVVAFNKGGLSFPSEILSAGTPGGNVRKVIVVNNFTRVSAPSSLDQPEYAGFTHSLDSGVPWGVDLTFCGEVNQLRRDAPWTSDDNPGHGGSFTDHAGGIVAGNTFDFVSVHGKVLLEAGFAFESSSSEAWDGSRGAFAADIICGKQLTTRDGRGAVPDKFRVFTDGLMNAIREFSSNGGNIVLSGSYIATDAWDAVYQGVPKAPEDTRKFIKEVLGYTYVTNFGDRSGTVIPSYGTNLPEVSYNRNYSPSIYRVENPDGIAPASGIASVILPISPAFASAPGSKYLMHYSGTNIGAAVLFVGKGYKAASFGFPLEASSNLPGLLSATLSLF